MAMPLGGSASHSPGGLTTFPPLACRTTGPERGKAIHRTPALYQILDTRPTFADFMFIVFNQVLGLVQNLIKFNDSELIAHNKSEMITNSGHTDHINVP